MLLLLVFYVLKLWSREASTLIQRNKSPAVEAPAYVRMSRDSSFCLLYVYGSSAFTHVCAPCVFWCQGQKAALGPLEGSPTLCPQLDFFFLSCCGCLTSWEVNSWKSLFFPLGDLGGFHYFLGTSWKNYIV